MPIDWLDRKTGLLRTLAPGEIPPAWPELEGRRLHCIWELRRGRWHPFELYIILPPSSAPVAQRLTRAEEDCHLLWRMYLLKGYTSSWYEVTATPIPLDPLERLANLYDVQTTNSTLHVHGDGARSTCEGDEAPLRRAPR